MESKNINNSFITTFGIEPINQIQRNDEKQTIINDFGKDTPTNYVYLITGPRGCGKTVFLSNVSNHFKKLKNWIVVDSGPGTNLIENLASSLYDEASLNKLFIQKEFSFSFHGLTFSINGEKPLSSAFSIFKKMVEYLTKKKINILITIDEVEINEDMKSFVKCYQSLLRENFPIRLLMTGLYKTIYNFQNQEGLTFLLRAPKINLKPLNIVSIARSYSEILSVTLEKGLEFAKLTNGYAFAYQILGKILFDQIKKEINQKLLNEFDQYLNEYAYEKIYSELSKKEVNILKEIKTNEPIEPKYIYKKLKISQKDFSVYRDSLIKKGILISLQYGTIQFALPRFYEFLLFK